MEKELLEMLEYQDKLNKKINENWREIRKREDFIRAIWIECAELVDSLPWKWWKKQEADIDNVKIEIVDIWHFILSYLLMEDKTYNDVINSNAVKYFKKGLNKDFTHLELDGTYIHHYLGENNKTDRIIFLAERVAEGFLKNSLNEGIYFFGLLVSEVLKFKELYLLYIGKNILNHIRQEGGYREGNYKKLINGLEDNKYMLEVVKNVNNKNELENKLRELFLNVNAK